MTKGEYHPEHLPDADDPDRCPHTEIPYPPDGHKHYDIWSNCIDQMIQKNIKTYEGFVKFCKEKGFITEDHVDPGRISKTGWEAIYSAIYYHEEDINF